MSVRACRRGAGEGIEPSYAAGSCRSAIELHPLEARSRPLAGVTGILAGRGRGANGI